MHFFFVFPYNGLAVLLKPSINRRLKLQNPRRHWISLIVLDIVQSQMACVLTGCVLSPSCPMMNSSYSVRFRGIRTWIV